jgi:hypothetical protein
LPRAYVADQLVDKIGPRDPMAGKPTTGFQTISRLRLVSLSEDDEWNIRREMRWKKG